MGVDQVELCSIHAALYMKEPKVNVPSELFPVKLVSILYSQARVSSIAMKGPTFSLLQHQLALRRLENLITSPNF